MLPLSAAVLFLFPAVAVAQATTVENPPLDEPLLAVQIGGIVGAYVIFVAITLTLLLVVGRRLRRTVQSSNYSLEVEMMKPKAPITTTASTDPSPVTPTNRSGFRSWTSLTKGHQSKPSHNGSVSTIDHESVITADRRRAQEQMEMLYAAVMEHDEQRSAAATSPVSPQDSIDMKEMAPRSPLSYHHSNPFSDPYRTQSQQFPPQPQHHHRFEPHQFQQQLGRTPGSPGFAPAAPAPAPAPAVTIASPPTSPRSTTSRLSRISNLSLFHSNSNPNSSNIQEKGHKLRSPRLPLRKLPISSPLASPGHPSPASDQIPLSPRLYNPPPPPAPPGTITRTSTSTSQDRGNGIRGPALPTLNLQAAGAAPGAGRSSSSLPFREAYPQLLSAPPTKTTYLDRPEKGLNGPRTGLPTPYSPYMPFTPLTPMTPSRIVTKKQRKKEGRENGLKALNEEDAVRDENEMWGY